MENIENKDKAKIDDSYRERVDTFQTKLLERRHSNMKYTMFNKDTISGYEGESKYVKENFVRRATR